MPVLIVIELEGATAAQHDEAEALLGSGPENPPQGLISHTAGITESGLVVADVWESMEDAEAFFETLGPALGQVGVAPAQPTAGTVHHHVDGNGEDAGIMVVIPLTGMTLEEYDEVTSHIPDDSHPAVLHVVGITDDGLLVVDIWGSAEEFAAFGQEVLAPHMGERMAELKPQFSQVHIHEVAPAGATG